MEEKTKTTSAFVMALVAILASISVPITSDIFDNELKDYYICSVNEEIMECEGGISGTAYTCYPYMGSRKGYQRCGSLENKGEWMDVEKYMHKMDLTLEEIMPKLNEDVINEEPLNDPTIKWGKSFRCNENGCTFVSGVE